MYQKTPFRSQRLMEPHRDKENVKSAGLTTLGPGRTRTPMKALDSPVPLTPSRQPLAPVNGTGSGLRGQQLRRLTLKPSLPRIEALRNEGVAGKLDGGCSPRGCKTPKRTKRQKSKSCSTIPAATPATTHASLSNVTKPKPEDSIVDSITSQLFDRLVQAELGLTGTTTKIHQPQMLRRSCASSQLTPLASDATQDAQDGVEIGGTSREEEGVSAFVEGIISSAVQTLQEEARIASLSSDAKMASDMDNHTLKSPTRREPTDEDIESYVDAVLSVQLQLVRMENEEKLNSCLDDGCSPECPQSDVGPKESLSDSLLSKSLVDDRSEGLVCDDIDGSFVRNLSFESTTPSRVSTGDATCSSYSSLLLHALEDTPFGSSPSYMLLPPRREMATREEGVGMRHHSCDSQDSYEDEFLRFVHKQYGSRNVMDESPVGSAVKVASVGVAMTPVKQSQIKLTDSSTDMGIETMESGCDARHLEVYDAMVGTPVRQCTAGVATSPVGVQDTASCMTPVKVQSTGMGTSPARVQDFGTEMPAIHMSDTGVEMSPKALVSVQDTASCMTPVKVQSTGIGTSPARVQDSGTEMPTINLMDTGVGMSPLPTRTETAVGTSPKASVVVQDTASCMTPIKLQTIGMGTSPAKVQDSGTEMPAVHLMDTGVGKSPLPTRKETAVGTTPKATMDREVGSSPVGMKDMNCGTSPHQHTDSNTAMTPILVKSTETLTSPPVVPSLRFSMSPSSFDPTKLVSHVQTAAISNQLLRTEVQMLRSQKAEANERLTVARREVQQKEDQVVVSEDAVRQMKRTARASADKEIEDLMGQMGEQMMQIGQLEAALREKTQMISSLTDDNQKIKKGYKQQIADLQDDLCRAYRQHQQQISELEADYKKEDYQRHYMRSQKRVSELEMQLDAFIQLQDTVDRAIQVQNKFGVAQKTFDDVTSLFQITIQHRDKVTLQMKTLEEGRASLEEERTSWKQQMEDGERRMRENDEKMEEMMKSKEEAEERRCVMEKDLAEATAGMKHLQGTLESREADMAEKEKELQELSRKCIQLEEREVAHFLEQQNQEAAILVQVEQHKALQGEFKQMQKSLQETVNQLHKQCQSISTEKLSLGVNLESTKAKLYSVEAELEDIKKTSEVQGTRVSELELQLETCRNAETDLILVKSKLKTLERQFQENKQFLEEERTALEESAVEVENELRITSMELSRSKASLCEAELIRRQLQESMSSLSEQLESLQSELDHTKAQAHWMLFNQGSEISDASAALAELSQGILSAVAKIPDQSVEKVEEASTRGFVTERRSHGPSHRSKHGKSSAASAKPGSLVVSVLRAVDHLETPGKATNSGEAEPVALEQQEQQHKDGDRRLTIRQSGSSAFQAVKPNTQDDHQQEERPLDDFGDKKFVEPLANQVLKLKASFAKMVTIFMENEEKLREEVGRLRQETQEKDQGSKKTLQRSENQVRLLRDQLEESLSHRHQLQQSLADTQNQSCEQLQSLDYAQQRIESMATNLARFSDQKSKIEGLEQEVGRLSSSLQLVTREKEMVMGQFEALASQPRQAASSSSSSPTGDGESMGKLLKENLHLKKELDKTRMKFFKRQEDYELFHSKAGKQMKVLEGNWRKAEAEIRRLDQLFDHCRKIMDKVPSTVCQVDPNLKMLHEMFSTQ